MIQNTLYVALGGAIGAVARYAISSWIYLRWPSAFPWGTLTVNVLGCFVMGWLAQVSASSSWSPALKLLLTTGLLGALTTFSTFSLETLRCWQQQQVWLAVLNVVANGTLSLLAVVAGTAAAKWLGAVQLLES